MYLEAVEDAFGSEIDFSQLIKKYGNTPEISRYLGVPRINATALLIFLLFGFLFESGNDNVGRCL